MARDLQCDYCLEVQGICTECGGCFGEHCDCEICQHGKARAEECVFCGRGFGITLIDSMVQSEDVDIQKDIAHLLGEDTDAN